MATKKTPEKSPAKKARAAHLYCEDSSTPREDEANNPESTSQPQTISRTEPVEITFELTVGKEAAKIRNVEKIAESVKQNKGPATDSYQTELEPGVGRPLDLISPSLINDQTKNDPVFRQIVIIQIEEHLRNWQRTNNGAFVWMAWRCAMHLDAAPPSILAAITEYFNECAVNLVGTHNAEEIAQALHLANRRGGAKGKGFSSTAYQAEDYWFWIDYKNLKEPDRKTGSVRSSREVYEALAARYGLASRGAAKQRLLRILRSGQYGNRSRTR